MRRRFYYDADLEAVVEIGANYFDDTPRTPNVISDDVGAGINGLRHMASGQHFDSKSRHRAENRARGLEEVGNEQNFASRREHPGADYYGEQVKDARDQIAGNWNGTADWLRRQNEQSRK